MNYIYSGYKLFLSAEMKGLHQLTLPDDAVGDEQGILVSDYRRKENPYRWRKWFSSMV